MNTLKLYKPRSFHDHLREGELLMAVLPAYAKAYSATLAMPNLLGGVKIATLADLIEYQAQVEAAKSQCGCPDFHVDWSIRLTPCTTEQTIVGAKEHGALVMKFYPPNTTTNSSQENWHLDDSRLLRNLSVMEEIGMIFSGHLEFPGSPHLTAEQDMIPFLRNLVRLYPRLKIVVEHVSSEAMIDFIERETSPDFVGGGITPQHLVLTISDVVANADNFCLPCAKLWADRDAVIRVATSGDPRWWFCPDGAPHSRSAKECAKPKGGISNPLVALAVGAEVFEEQCALEKLGPFMAESGPHFYNVPVIPQEVTLVKRPWIVPDEFNGVRNFLAGRQLAWQVIG